MSRKYPTPDGRRPRVLVELTDEEHVYLKIAAAKERETLKGLVRKALRELGHLPQDPSATEAA